MQRWIRLLGLVLFFTTFHALAQTAATPPYGEKAIELADQQGDYVGAERMVRADISAVPNNAKMHYFLARVLYDKGDAASAKIEADQAVTLDHKKYSTKDGDPIHFVKQERFDQFQSDLAKALAEPHHAAAKTVTTTTTSSTVKHAFMAPVAAAASPHVVRAAPTPSLSGFLMFLIICAIGIVVIGFAIWIITRIFAKKETPQPVVQERVVHVHDTIDRPYVDRTGFGGYGGTSQSRPAAPPAAPPVSRPYVASVVQQPAPVVQQGHSTGAVVGAGLGGLAAGMLLDEMIHNGHSHGGGYRDDSFVGGGGRFGGGGSTEEIDTTTTTTTTYDEPEEPRGSSFTDDDVGGGNDWSDNSSADSSDGGGGWGDDN